MHDMGLAAGIEGLELRPFEDAFERATQDVRRAHRHDYYKIGLLTTGRGVLSADFAEYQIRPPMLLQFAPGVVHGWRPSAVPRGYAINFERTFFGADPGEQAQITDAPIFCVHSGPKVLPLSSRQLSLFEGLARAMLREYQSRGADHASALRSYLRIWLIEASRIAAAREPSRWNDRGTALTNQFLCLVGQDFHSVSGVSEYAARLRITPSHLNETVRRTLGKTAGEVIRGRILLEAKRLLRHSELSVAEIAYRLQFEDPSYFARFFRKQTGQAPAEFRAQP
jgi:AraC-like DNA-binding protein